MKALEIIVFGAVIGGLLLVAVVGAVARWTRRHQALNAPWQVREHSDGELLTVSIERPFEDPLHVGAVAHSSQDFDERLFDLRALAASRCAALNTRA